MFAQNWTRSLSFRWLVSTWVDTWKSRRRQARLKIAPHFSMISMLCAITMATYRVDITLVGTVYSLWFAYIIDIAANGKIYAVSLKMHQLWSGIAQNYKDRFWWNLAEIFKRHINRVCVFQFAYRFAFLSTVHLSNQTPKIFLLGLMFLFELFQ